jgi:glycine/sarcosine N-methyltransferase
MDFYEHIAGRYDEMTRFDQRLTREETTLAQWRERFDIHSAVDAACGTGLQTIALYRLGVTVIGADISGAMLDRARANARRYQADIQFVQAGMEEMAGVMDHPVDAVFSLGNSIPHLLTDDALKRALSSFHDLVRPGGVVVIQLLNYHRVLTRRERIVGVTRSGETEFIRFYDFGDRTIRFNIMTIEWREGKPRTRLMETELAPYRRDELVTVFGEAGFRHVQSFGDMTFGVYHAEESSNLVLVGQRG